MPDKFQTVTFPPLSQGMVTLQNSSSLDDRAGNGVLNMEYELSDMPATRRGVTCWSEESAANHKFDKRISSLAYFKNNSTPALGVLIATTGQEVYRSDTDIEDKQYTSILGAMTIDDDVDWVWVPYRQLGAGSGAFTAGLILIGLPDQATATGAAPENNLVVWQGSGNLLQPTSACDYKALAMIECNRRMFFINREDATQLIWSQLGSFAASKTTQQITASGNGFAHLPLEMIGLGKTRERVFCFMRDAIYQLKFGEPETDQNLFQIEPLTTDGGCINRQCIIPVLDDLYFLSDYGWVSLNAVEKFGDFEQALLSDKLLELKQTPRVGAVADLKCHRAINYYEKNQVWISVPSASEAEAVRRWNKNAFIMHYHPDVFGNVGTDRAFTRFTGRAPFTAATVATYKNRRRLFIAKEITMDVPAGVGAALATGGTNPNGTYYFKVVAVDQYGEETTPSAEVSATVVDATNDRITISWTAHNHATNIRIYKGATSNGQDRYKQTTGGATSFNWDDDTGATLKALPQVNLARLHNIFLTDDKTTLSDDLTKFGGTAVSEILESHVETKDYVFGNEGIRKIADYWSVLIRLFGTTFTGVYSYILDYNPDNQKSDTFTLTSPADPLWDSALYDSSAFASGLSPFKKFSKKLVGHPGRLFHAIRFKFKCLTGERWGFRGLSIDVAGIDAKESSDAA